jgi:bifunctional non-homologous end joining protein LigD
VSLARRLAEELGAPIGDVDARALVPMLCAHDETKGAIVSQQGWIYELKLDGVRIVLDKRGPKVSLSYRKLRSATDSYPEIADAAKALAEERIVLDGEIVAFDEKGRPDFQLLAQRIHTRGRDGKRAFAVVYVVFDILAIGDRDLRRLPLEARKLILEKALPESPWLRLHPTFADGKALQAFCKQHDLEGLVAKRAGSPYRSGARVTDWVKVKESRDAEFVVVGWVTGEGKRSALGSLDLASWDGKGWVVRGAVGSGLDLDTIDLLLDRMKALVVSEKVATGRYNPKPGNKRFHVRPEIVVSIRYMSFTSDGVLRFPVFRGIRADIDPRDCTTHPEER